jgi:hypothetical protein
MIFAAQVPVPRARQSKLRNCEAAGFRLKLNLHAAKAGGVHRVCQQLPQIHETCTETKDQRPKLKALAL